jgi:hypothetical protein
MSPIHKIFADMTNEQLFNALEEIKETERTGIIGYIVRDYAIKMREITGSHSILDLSATQWLLWREAASRWQNRVEGWMDDTQNTPVYFRKDND